MLKHERFSEHVAGPSLPGGGPAVVRSEVVNPRGPTPQVHASTLVETAEGLLAAWFGGAYERHPAVGIWLSRFEDGRWTAPVEVARGLQPDGSRLPTWNPVLFEPRDGPLMLFYKVGPSPSAWWGMRMTSTDAGRTWTPPERLPDGILGPIKNKPVQLPDGVIVSPSSTEANGWRVHFERSTDGGATWHSTGPVHDTARVEAIQPSLLLHPGGRLQAVGRTRQGKMFSITSEDGGRSWGAMTLTHLPNPNAGLDAVTLADGRHLVVYNHATGDPERWEVGRHVLNLAVSEDGVTWQAALLLEDEPGTEFSYPAVIQTRDGRVHVAYTWKRRHIRHVVVDPARLVPRPIVDGQWPG